MSRSFDVSVVGLYILDVLGRPVERIPEGGNVEFIDEIRLTVAGTAGGTVVDLAKLGLKCQAVGAVGDDEKADFVLNHMEKVGIDCRLMRQVPDVETSATILNVRAQRRTSGVALSRRIGSFRRAVRNAARCAGLPVFPFGGNWSARQT